MLLHSCKDKRGHVICLADEIISRRNPCHFQEKGLEPVYIRHIDFHTEVIVEAFKIKIASLSDDDKSSLRLHIE